MADSTQKPPYVFVRSFEKNISVIRTNLLFQANGLRQDFDSEEAERVARRLDELRMVLKPLVEDKGV
jgi:hypothetical protein